MMLSVALIVIVLVAGLRVGTSSEIMVRSSRSGASAEGEMGGRP
jgi:hypothetical protein